MARTLKGWKLGKSSSGRISGVPSTLPHVNCGASSTPGAGDGVSRKLKPPTRGEAATCLRP